MSPKLQYKSVFAGNSASKSLLLVHWTFAYCVLVLQRPAKLDSRVPTSLQDEITELDNPSSIKESAHQLQATNRNHQLKVGIQRDNSANPEIGKPLVNPAVEVSQTLSEVEGDNPLEEPNLAQYQM